MMQISRRVLAPAVVLAASAFVLAGCAGSGTASDSSPSAAGAEGVVVSTMYGDVTVPAASDDLTVVALGWSDAEMALALGVKPVAVYDWQGFGEENKGVGPWATELFGDVTPEIIEASGDSVNFEQIQALEPDLILNTRAADDEKVYDRLSEIAPTVYAPEGTAAFATAWDVQLEQVGAALNKSDEAADQVAETQAAIEQVATDNPAFAGLTAVAGTKFGDAYGAYLAGDGRFDILAEFGFVQNPPVLELEPAGFYANVSAEQIAALDANVAVLLPIGFTEAEILADPLLSTLNVVKDGRAIVLDGTDELSGAYSAASVLSIPVVLEQLVPKLADAAAKVQ